MKFASLFSGCGGLDIGFFSRGYSSSGAFDNEPDAVTNYGANIEGPVHRVDLTNGVPIENSLLGVDALIAGPPCQGFSTAGKRLLDDERNQLLTLTGVLARRIQPKVLVVENVSGALAGEHARYLKDLDTTMRLAGYRTYFKKFQVGELGVAQLRRRILFFAWRTGREIEFSFRQVAPRTLRSALSGASRHSNHRPQRLPICSREWLIAQRIKPGQKLSNVRGGQNAVATWDIPEVFGCVSVSIKLRSWRMAPPARLQICVWRFGKFLIVR